MLKSFQKSHCDNIAMEEIVCSFASALSKFNGIAHSLDEISPFFVHLGASATV